MKADSNPTVLVIVLVTVVAWLLSRAGTASQRSRKLGILATALGVAACVPAVVGPVFKDPGQARTLAAWGVITLLLAVSAVGLAIWTFLVRRRDQGVSIAYPILGLILGITTLLAGAGLFLIGSGVLAPSAGSGPLASTGETQRTWRSDTHGIEVTIPSEHWIERTNPNVLVQFSGTRPPCMAIVAEARPARTNTEYEEVLAFGRKVRNDTPTSDTNERSGANRHGHPHWMYMGWARGPNGPYYFGLSITRVRDKAVILMFEGQGRLVSEAGRAQEAVALRNVADIFLCSVK